VERIDGYAPIEDYALIGDGRTCALVAGDGSIDWLALPRLDSQTVFARLLDAERGGAFELAPEIDFRAEREYVGDSNVLQTTFVTRRGTVRVTDAITLDNGGFLPWFELVRGIEGISGTVPMGFRITPRFGAGEKPEETTIERLGAALLAASQPAILALHTFDAGEPHHSDDEITGSFELSKGERVSLVLRASHDEPIPVARREWALDGYRGSRPVRRGNAAAGQLQLGCYRALRLVERGQLPRERAERWRESAKQVREFVERECWSEPRGCYTMFPGSTRLDASILRASRMGFLDVTCDRFSTIIDAIRDELDAGGGLVYRYSGQQRVEGAFVACSFWLVEALARAGRFAEARETMGQVIARRNDVGLFSEEIDPETGAFLGNFPQGLSHLALINAAAALRDQS
jgi:hypothetical protein